MSTNVNSLLASIPKLTAENHHEWKFMMQMVLRRAGSWSVINGTDAMPPATRSDNLAEWKKLSEDGLTVIELAISPSQQPYIRDCTKGPEAWKALAAVYEANNHANRISLKRQFYNYRHDTEKPILEYINGITTLAGQLRAIGVKLEEDEVPDTLIACLSPVFSGVATALAQRTGKLTVSDITAALVDEEGFVKGRQTLSPEVESMFKVSTTRAAGSPALRPPLICHRCGVEGHIARYCIAERPQQKTESTMTSKALLAHTVDAGDEIIQLF